MIREGKALKKTKVNRRKSEEPRGHGGHEGEARRKRDSEKVNRVWEGGNAGRVWEEGETRRKERGGESARVRVEGVWGTMGEHGKERNG